MPFILICGNPSCGKSRRTEELKKYFENEQKKTVVVFSDHNTGVDRNKVYADSKEEKIVRGNLKSSVQRNLSKETITILDSLNYIKGFRYELYCVTKECQTTQCVIFCDTSKELASEWNNSRAEEEKYLQQIFDGLVQRFEEPRSNNRWDSPLFVIQKDDVLPLDAISDALLKKKAPAPNASTAPQPLSSTNFLYELDKTTQDVVGVIMGSQKTCVPGDNIGVSGATDQLQYTRPLTLAELQRLRRQFITYMKMHPVSNHAQLTNMFIQYLNNTLK
ncbi:protein KTI12 homolog [Dreissena polymorpha]|uniref:Protein KTI12 homolog n=1 Tax=Dreissena polymorpha TaxID=45954 RepID=A0A9D3YXE0_DREPO|nr:protein KTI12 homolog [Dreissena polymorpha]KAH3707066.1 hypothetical protein DPMN_066461 [Dreissena polymorpha]